MSTAYHYQLVNVFAETHFGGNPLAVFTQADQLTDQQMQLIARQFNLSEVVFLHSTNEKRAVKKLRIFTPEYELSFAGHPTIGAAFVLKQQLNLPNTYTLETNIGVVPIYHQQNQTRFSLNTEIKIQRIENNFVLYAELLGLKTTDIAQIAWVNMGSQQLLIQLKSEQAIKTCQIQTALFHQLLQKSALYLWFEENYKVKVRLFFGLNGGVIEDPGTGSAASSLGGLCIHNGLIPLDWKITQGDEIQRPNRLTLTVDEQKNIFVGGEVITVGYGEFLVP